MSLGGSLLLKRKGKSVILCGTAGAGFPVALGAPTPAQECGDCSPVLCQWYFIGPLGGTFKKKKRDT